MYVTIEPCETKISCWDCIDFTESMTYNVRRDQQAAVPNHDRKDDQEVRKMIAYK